MVRGFSSKTQGVSFLDRNAAAIAITFCTSHSLTLPVTVIAVQGFFFIILSVSLMVMKLKIQKYYILLMEHV